MSSDSRGSLQFQPPNRAASPPNSKVRRAYLSCETCRKRKTRCVANPSGQSQPCQRCELDGRECVMRSTRNASRRRPRHQPPRDPSISPASIGNLNNKANATGSINVGSGGDCPSDLERAAADAGVFQCEPSPIEPSPPGSQPSARRRIISAHLHNTADDLDLLTFTAASQQCKDYEVTPQTVTCQSQASIVPTMPSGTSDWERFVLIKRRILSKTELIEYLDFYFSIIWSIRPVVPPFYRDRERYGILPIEEPLLVLTLITISSRYHVLSGLHGEIRSERIHWQTWKICQQYLQSALWGSSYTRTPGAVASMLLLIEWHPKAINNTVAFSNDEEPESNVTGSQNLLQREPLGTQSGQHTSLTSQQRYGMATLLEDLNIVAPAYRSNKMSWMLLSNAIALAQEGCCFDYDQQSTNKEPLKSTTQSAKDTLRQQWNQLNCVFIYLTDEHLSLRLGLRPLLPESQREAVRYRFSTTFASLLPDSALWESYYELFNETRRLRTLLQSLRKPGVSTPPSADILPEVQHVDRALSRWRRSHENLKADQSELLTTCLDLEYHYMVMYSCAPAGHVLYNNVSMALADDKRQALSVLDKKAADASRDILSIFTRVSRPSHITRYLPVRCWLFIVSANLHLLRSTLIINPHVSEAHQNVQLLRESIKSMREGAADDIHMSVRYARFLDILLDASLYSSSRVHSPSGADQEGFVHQGLGTTIIPQVRDVLDEVSGSRQDTSFMATSILDDLEMFDFPQSFTVHGDALQWWNNFGASSIAGWTEP
ncbi:hypothetical protein CABS01_10043 [Colletotrichum abscissum]|uniref:uncharacterized protein n=1 Tax=Colletotrichum abscissum TaxID=1671311 RepID=UPI0027D6DB23|nr:uncharacterized protein CABS01_10043 [Colletotrichum abscissum]KAK1500319.1 hypothetical protein CABS01_10043 [Colletotrichum abscissum]